MDNENTILKHQCDLKERYKELNVEAIRLQHEQDLVRTLFVTFLVKFKTDRIC